MLDLSERSYGPLNSLIRQIAREVSTILHLLSIQMSDEDNDDDDLDEKSLLLLMLSRI